MKKIFPISGTVPSCLQQEKGTDIPDCHILIKKRIGRKAGMIHGRKQGPLYDENGNLLEETYMLDEDMGELEEEEEEDEEK